MEQALYLPGKPSGKLFCQLELLSVLHSRGLSQAHMDLNRRIGKGFMNTAKIKGMTMVYEPKYFKKILF